MAVQYVKYIQGRNNLLLYKGTINIDISNITFHCPDLDSNPGRMTVIDKCAILSRMCQYIYLNMSFYFT